MALIQRRRDPLAGVHFSAWAHTVGGAGLVGQMFDASAAQHNAHADVRTVIEASTLALLSSSRRAISGWLFFAARYSPVLPSCAQEVSEDQVTGQLNNRQAVVADFSRA